MLSRAGNALSVNIGKLFLVSTPSQSDICTTTCTESGTHPCSVGKFALLDIAAEHEIMTSQTNESHSTAAARLRAKLAEPGAIVVGPGVYDGITARIALKTGFNCLYMVW